MVEFGTDMNAMLSEMEKEETAGKFVSKYWSPKTEGITKIRFLPQLQSFGEKIFYQKHSIHYVNGRPYFCLNQSLKDKNGNIHEAEECPFCKKSKQFYSTANNDKNSEDWKRAGELRAKDRFVSRVIVREKKGEKGEDLEFKPEFYEFGLKIREIIKAAIVSKEYGNPFDLKEGRDFNLSKRGQKKNTDYSGSMFSGNSSKIFEDKAKLQALLEEIPKMDYCQLVEFETADSMKKILKEYLDGDSEDDTPITVPETGLTDDMIMGVAASIAKAESSGDDDIDALLNSI